jgi:hypothetical protein
LRERELRNLVRKRKKPIVLMVNEAHDLHHHTLTGLKRLIEMVADGDGKLCVLLAGHPKLRRDLRNPTMEEIGYHTAVFSLEGVTGSQREYIEWMLATCAADKAKVDAILDPAAVDLLASRLRTPLQIEQHLTLALETGYQASEKPVGEAIVDSVLSKQIDDLEPTLTRRGYTAKVLTEMLGTKPGEIKALSMGSERQSGGEHLLLQFAGAVDLQCLLEGQQTGRLSAPPGLPSVAISVGTTPMIAIPVAAFMGPVAMIVGPAPQIRCNDFGHGRPMIAIPPADDCGSLHLFPKGRPGRPLQPLRQTLTNRKTAGLAEVVFRSALTAQAAPRATSLLTIWGDAIKRAG